MRPLPRRLTCAWTCAACSFAYGAACSGPPQHFGLRAAAPRLFCRAAAAGRGAQARAQTLWVAAPLTACAGLPAWASRPSPAAARRSGAARSPTLQPGRRLALRRRCATASAAALPPSTPTGARRWRPAAPRWRRAWTPGGPWRRTASTAAPAPSARRWTRSLPDCASSPTACPPATPLWGCCPSWRPISTAATPWRRTCCASCATAPSPCRSPGQRLRCCCPWRPTLCASPPSRATAWWGSRRAWRPRPGRCHQSYGPAGGAATTCSSPRMTKAAGWHSRRWAVRSCARRCWW